MWLQGECKTLLNRMSWGQGNVNSGINYMGFIIWPGMSPEKTAQNKTLALLMGHKIQYKEKQSDIAQHQKNEKEHLQRNASAQKDPGTVLSISKVENYSPRAQS